MNDEDRSLLIAASTEATFALMALHATLSVLLEARLIRPAHLGQIAARLRQVIADASADASPAIRAGMLMLADEFIAQLPLPGRTPPGRPS